MEALTKYPTTKATASSAPYDDVDLTNVTNIGAADTNYCTYTGTAFDLNVYTYLIKAQNFGFSIPAGATILSLWAEVRARCYTGTVNYVMVKLLNASGTAEGDNKASTPLAVIYNNTTFRVDTFGHDLWGVSLTPTMLNDVDFGIQLAFQASQNNATLYIDYVRLNAAYTTEFTSVLDMDNQLIVPANFFSDFSLPDSISTFNPDHTERELVDLLGVNDYFEMEGEGTIVVPTEGQIWPRGNW